MVSRTIGNFLARQKANIQRGQDPRLALWLCVCGVVILALSGVLVTVPSLSVGWILGSGWTVSLGLATLCSGAAGLVPEVSQSPHRLIVGFRVAALSLLAVFFVSFIGFQTTEQALEAWFAPAPYNVWLYTVIFPACISYGFLRVLLGYGRPCGGSKSSVPEEGTASEAALKRTRARAGRRKGARIPETRTRQDTGASVSLCE